MCVCNEASSGLQRESKKGHRKGLRSWVGINAPFSGGLEAKQVRRQANQHPQPLQQKVTVAAASNRTETKSVERCQNTFWLRSKPSLIEGSPALGATAADSRRRASPFAEAAPCAPFAGRCFQFGQQFLRHGPQTTGTSFLESDPAALGNDYVGQAHPCLPVQRGKTTSKPPARPLVPDVPEAVDRDLRAALRDR